MTRPPGRTAVMASAVVVPKSGEINDHVEIERRQFLCISHNLEHAALSCKIPDFAFRIGRVHLRARKDGHLSAGESETAETDDADTLAGKQLPRTHHSTVGSLAGIGGGCGLHESTASGKRTSPEVLARNLSANPPSTNQPGDCCGSPNATTRLPIAHQSTPGPTSLTTPATSCPSTRGSFASIGVSVPSRKPTSLWQMPAARTSTTSCSGPGAGSSGSISCSGSLAADSCHALTGFPLRLYVGQRV